LLVLIAGSEVVAVSVGKLAGALTWPESVVWKTVDC